MPFLYRSPRQRLARRVAVTLRIHPLFLVVAALDRVRDAAELRAPAEVVRVPRLRPGTLGGDDADAVLAEDVGKVAHGLTACVRQFTARRERRYPWPHDHIPGTGRGWPGGHSRSSRRGPGPTGGAAGP